MFEGNTFSINVFLFLCVLGFFIVGIDLSSELAKEKDEINYVLDNLEDGCNIPQLSPKGLDEITRPLETSIPEINNFNYSHTFKTAHNDRGPPIA
jgi:hypothetical protein